MIRNDRRGGIQASAGGKVKRISLSLWYVRGAAIYLAASALALTLMAYMPDVAARWPL